jgi:hypothetical protein
VPFLEPEGRLRRLVSVLVTVLTHGLALWGLMDLVVRALNTPLLL